VTCWHPREGHDELLVALGRVMRAFRMLLADQGLEPASVALLFEAGRSGPVRVSALAETVGLDVSTVSRHVRNLVAAGHLRRSEDPDDGRATLLHLTPDGAALLAAAMSRRAEVLRRATADWPDADRDTLATLLGRLGDGLAAAAGHSPDRPPGTRGEASHPRGDA
jgi:DNA-binding MarR family transcriptional regulator